MIRIARRTGFSLVELLVVIAIIGVLISLLLPAVQRVRESANRAQCQNNLRQMGLAVHGHHDVLGYFPCAGVNQIPYNGGNQLTNSGLYNTVLSGAPAIGPAQSGSWMFQILPYLEQHNVWSSTSLATIVGTPIDTYFCPTRRKPVAANGWQGGANVYGLSDYYGSNQQANGIFSVQWLSLGGSFAVNSQPPITIGQVRDGTSNTMIIGEKNLCLPLLSTGHDYCDSTGYSWGADWGGGGHWDNSLGNPDIQPQPDSSNPANCGEGSHGFGSSHPHAFNAAFCDGSVQAISYNVSSQVFQDLCNIADGNAIADGSY